MRLGRKIIDSGGTATKKVRKSETGAAAVNGRLFRPAKIVCFQKPKPALRKKSGNDFFMKYLYLCAQHFAFIVRINKKAVFCFHKVTYCDFCMLLF